MKLSEGFTKLVPSALKFVFYAASFVALTFALKGIDVSISYAIWSGIGTVANSNHWHSVFSGASDSIKNS
jgi:small multidrug resistance pump